MAVSGGLLGDALNKLVSEIQQWGEKNIANPIRTSAVSLQAFGERNVADPTREFAKFVQSWGERNIADPTRDALTTSDGRNAVAAFWGDLLSEWVYGHPTEASQAAAAAGTSVDEMQATIDSLARADQAKDENLRGINPVPVEQSPVGTATDDSIAAAPAPRDTAGGDAGAPGAGGDIPLDETVSEPGPQQIPGGGEVWRIDGGVVYLAYTIPGTDKKIVWQVENPDRLKAIFGDAPVVYDKELTREEFKKFSPWRGGLSAELINKSEDPWQQFMSDFEAAAELRPWLRDEDMLAVISVAYFEGREPTDDELASTSWWNDHTAEERAWMRDSITLGREEVERRHSDAARLAEEKLREEGMTSPSAGIVEYIARQRLTGKWSETYANQQIAKVADPFAPGKLDRGLLAVVRDPNQGSAADAAAIAEGKPAVIRRIRQAFVNARVPIATDTETEEMRLNRIADEVMNRGRSMADVRQSIDLLAMKTEGGQIGGLQTTAKGEDEVRRLAQTWLGPVHGELSPDQITRWAGRLRNDASGNAAKEFEDYLKQQRLALFPEHQNENLTYEDIVTPWQNWLTNKWGTQVDLGDETLVQVARLNDIGEAGRLAREIGFERGYEPVVNEMSTGMLSAFGGGVRRAI